MTSVRNSPHDALPASLYSVNASAAPEKLEDVKEIMLKTMETLGGTPYTTEEVEKAILSRL